MLTIGDTILLESNYEGKQEKYTSMIVDYNEKDLFIDYPINIETSKAAFMLNGTQLTVTLIGNDNIVYMFDTEIVGRKKVKIPMLHLNYPGNEQLIKIQRRQFVRVLTSTDVAIHPTDFQFSPFVSVTHDISAGGASLLAPLNFEVEKGTIIDIIVVLVMKNGEIAYFHPKAKIIRILEMNTGRKKVSVEFIDVSAHDRQLLLRYCFERQIENRSI